MSELSRFKWRCRRGQKELDIVLTRYLENRYPKIDDEEKQAFNRLLEIEDPDLFSLLNGKTQSSDPAVQQIINILQNSLISAK